VCVGRQGSECVMYPITCAWCGCVIGECEIEQSHGMCPRCAQIESAVFEVQEKYSLTRDQADMVRDVLKKSISREVGYRPAYRAGN